MRRPYLSASSTSLNETKYVNTHSFLHQLKREATLSYRYFEFHILQISQGLSVCETGQLIYNIYTLPIMHN